VTWPLGKPWAKGRHEKRNVMRAFLTVATAIAAAVVAIAVDRAANRGSLSLPEVIHRERFPAPLSRHCRMDTWELTYFSAGFGKPPFPNGGWIVQFVGVVDGKVEREHLATFTTFDQAAAFLRQTHASTHGDEATCPR
jgi:hypothetical protein